MHLELNIPLHNDRDVATQVLTLCRVQRSYGLDAKMGRVVEPNGRLLLVQRVTYKRHSALNGVVRQLAQTIDIQPISVRILPVDAAVVWKYKGA